MPMAQQKNGVKPSLGATLSETNGVRVDPGLSIPISPTSRRELQALDALVELKERGRLPKQKLTWLEFVLGTHLGQCLILLITAVALILLCTLCWSMYGGDSNADDSFTQSLWISWGLFFDPGTQTGIHAGAPEALKWIAVTFSVFGFLFNLVVLGKLVDAVRNILSDWRRTYQRIALSNHVVVLNWSCKTLFLLEEMLHETKNMGVRDQTIVIMADVDEVHMMNEVNDFLNLASLGNCRMICRQGKPYNADDLRRISAVYAKEIIVLSSEERSDLDVMQVMMSLGSMRDPVLGRIVVEVKKHDIIPALRYIYPNATPIQARSAAHHVLCWMTINPLLGRCIASLCSFTVGHEFYSIPVGDLIGKTFKDACDKFIHGTCVAVKPAGDISILIAPPHDRVFVADDVILVLAPNRMVLDSSQTNAMDFVSFQNLVRQITSVNPTCPLPSLDSMEADFSFGAALVGDDLAKTFIVLGFPYDMMNILTLLEKFSPAGTVLHILSAMPIDEREHICKASNLKSRGTTTIYHHVGDRTSIASLRLLPISEAAAVLVLAEPATHQMRMDAECLASAVTLAGMCEGRFGEDRGRELNGPIICEILDPRTDRIRTRNPKLRGRCMFFRSAAIETGMFAMAASDPIVFEALVALVEPNNLGQLVVEPVSNYKLKDTFSNRQTVRDLVQTAAEERSSSDVLIGWMKKGDSAPQMASVVGSDSLYWEEGDHLILLRRPLGQISMRDVLSSTRPPAGV